MNELLDKLIIGAIIVAFATLVEITATPVLVGAALFAVTSSSICSFFTRSNKLSELIILIYILASGFFSILLMFLPLLAYEIYSNKNKYPLAIAMISIYLWSIYQGIDHLLPLLTLCFLGFILGLRTKKYEGSKLQYYKSQNIAREASLELASKNKNLLENRDYEVTLATLQERNRIAREIHDNVGHLITRSIMQTKALEVVCDNKDRGNQDLVPALKAVNQTLVDAMESIRESVHQIHDDSIDIKVELEGIINAFSFCHGSFTIEGDNLPIDVRHCFIAITKEALSNTAKHSNATAMSISIVQHPGFYQLICRDNGRSSSGSKEKSSGLGLQNIKDRAESLGGMVSITSSQGFRIITTIPVKDYKGAKKNSER